MPALKPAAVILVLAAACLVWALWGAEPAAGVPESAGERAHAAQRAAGAADDARQPLPEQARVMVSGRCVGPEGPVAGAGVALEVRRSGEDEAEGVGATSDRDGRFVVRAGGSEPVRFAGLIRASGFAAVRLDERELPAGGTCDLGDIRMMSGVRLSGVVTDSSGRPLSGYRIRGAFGYGRGWLAPGDPAVDGQFAARTDDAGRFEVSEPVAPGPWDVGFGPGLLQMSHEAISVPAGKPAMHVRLVEAASEAATIRGRVVDEGRNPLEDVSVRVAGERITSTDAEGRFTIHSTDRDGDSPVRVQLFKEGYDDPRNAPVRWGDDSAELSMRRCGGFVLQVTEADTGRPVVEYGIYMVPAPDNENIREVSVGIGAEYEGRHEDGVLRVPALAEVAYLVHVVPKDPRLAPSGLVPASAGDDTVRVALRRGVQRRVRVVHVDGSAVAGSEVQLVEAGDGVDVGPGTPCVQFGFGFKMVWNPVFAFLRQEVETDARGEAVVRGPAGTKLALRVFGAHPPAVVRELTLDPADPVVVTVEAGAIVSGRIRPLQVLSEARTIGGGPCRVSLQRLEPSDTADRELGPFVRAFAQQSDPEPEPVDATGRFGFRDVPPGEWELRLDWAADGLDGRSIHLRRLTLRAGQECSLDLDLTHLLTGDLWGTVVVDGVPAAGCEITPYRAADHDQLDKILRNLRLPLSSHVTDRLGRFRIQPFTGAYRIVVRTDELGEVAAEETATIIAGTRTHATFHVRTQPVDLLVLGPDGRLCSGVELVRGEAQENLRGSLPKSDASGRVRARLPRGRHRLWVWRNRWPVRAGEVDTAVSGVQTVKLPPQER